MSEIEQNSSSSIIKTIFTNENLTGFDIAKNTAISNQVKEDSTDFAVGVINHSRGREIVCELIDVALRPKLLIKHLQKQKQINNVTSKLSAFIEQVPKSYLHQASPQTTNITYNAIEILTNQYEEFVKFIFEDKPGPLIVSNECVSIPSDSEKSISEGLKYSQSNNKNSNTFPYIVDQDLQDCVIMDGNFPELSKNEEDEMLIKMNSSAKLNDSDQFQCDILERMFMLFEQTGHIDETPVSYFNKIILQFVYQKPQEIMRFFYCQDPFLTKKNEGSCSKIRKIAYHLYNHSVIELLAHLMQLQNDGNFFPQQKIQILKAITEQVFHYHQPITKNTNSFDQETSTMSDEMGDRVSNYILFLKTLYEKLQDRYEQEKFLQIFKYHLNDQKLLQTIISYFMHHLNYFDSSGLSTLLIQILKMDQTNFKLNKAASQASSPFGGNKQFSFTKNEQSSIAFYDLKLSKQILDQIEKVITALSSKYQQWQGSTMRMIEYYELIHFWLNVTIKDRQNYARKRLITPNFINECLFKIQSHQKSTILHNSIKNILVDFLPKLNDSIKIFLAPQCQLLQFIENYLENILESGKKSKKKCYQNQLFHIGKTLLLIWEQQKMLSVRKNTEDDEQDHMQRMPSQQPSSPTTDGENIVRFQKLKFIISKKQEIYDHLICGDPRKMGEYQQEQSSQIIMASSMKNFFKPNFNNNGFSQNGNNEMKPLGKDRYENEEKEEDQQKSSSKNKKQVEDLKRETNLKTDQRFRNLKIGDQHSNLLFESAISPLNANRSHTFNFDFDALPLDSDNSEQAVSEEEDLPGREGSGGANQDQIKLMQENIQNFEIIAGNVLGVQSNILSSSNSISNDKNFLASDNYRREELSKSMDIQDLNMDNIQHVDSYLAIDSPRKQSQDDIFSLGLDSNKESGSRFSDQNQGSKLQQLASENVASFIKQEQKNNGIRHEQDEDQKETMDSNFVKLYSSYLKYDLNDLCTEVE